MRISDWSSDVCPSDLREDDVDHQADHGDAQEEEPQPWVDLIAPACVRPHDEPDGEREVDADVVPVEELDEAAAADDELLQVQLGEHPFGPLPADDEGATGECIDLVVPHEVSDLLVRQVTTHEDG